MTGLTFMAIKKILEELEALNLIKYADVETGSTGRKAAAYAINADYGYTIGIHINKFVTSIALLDLCGNVLAMERCSHGTGCTKTKRFCRKTSVCN